MARAKMIYRETTEARECTSLFYGLEALKVAVQFGSNYSEFLGSNKRLLEDIIEYQNEVVEVISKMLYDYTVIACYGELRHMGTVCGTRLVGMGFGEKKIAYKEDRERKRHIEKFNRSVSYEKAVKYNPQQLLEICVKYFNHENWGGGYGGEKWLQIAKHGLAYHTAPNMLVWCDTAFSLSHNSSPYLDKHSTRIFCIEDTRKYKELLDIKFKCTPIEIISHIINDANYIDYRMLKLIRRAVALGFIVPYNMKDFNTWIKYQNKGDTLGRIANKYEPLKFKNKLVNPKEIFQCCTTMKENNFLKLFEVGRNVMVIEESKHTYMSKDWHGERGTIQYFVQNGKIENNFARLVVENVSRATGEVHIKDVKTQQYFKMNYKNLKIIDENFKVKKLA